MVYYALIMLSVIMFGGNFALQDLYRQKRGSGLKFSMELSCIGAISACVVLVMINGFSLTFTPFTIIMALCSTINGIAFTFCSFKALDHINLSLFSLFTMLGGMLLPFLQGIMFYDEKITIAKIVCVVFICISLALTFQKGENKKNGVIFYIGIFILNGLSGVISKIFSSSSLPKTSASEYMIWVSICTAIISGLVWLVLYVMQKRRESLDGCESVTINKKILLQSCGIGAINGAINKIANFLLVFALAFVDASIQYPMVTGGTMIVSTLLCFLSAKKPNKRELVSVLLAFVGLLAMFLIPV